MGKKFTQFRVNVTGLEDKHRWYIIVTQYNYEQYVTNSLLRIIEEGGLNGAVAEAFSGIKETEETYINSKGVSKIKIKNEKVFSNYVFVKTKLTPEIWNELMNLTGVASMLCVSGTPVSSTEQEITRAKIKLGILSHESVS